MVVYGAILELGRQSQEDQKFKAILNYRASLRSDWALGVYLSNKTTFLLACSKKFLNSFISLMLPCSVSWDSPACLPGLKLPRPTSLLTCLLDKALGLALREG